MKRTNSSADSQQLLYSREQAARLLGGVSISTITRLEQEGRLTPVRLSNSKTGQVFYRSEDVIALTKTGGSNEKR